MLCCQPLDKCLTVRWQAKKPAEWIGWLFDYILFGNQFNSLVSSFLMSQCDALKNKFDDSWVVSADWSPYWIYYFALWDIPTCGGIPDCVSLAAAARLHRSYGSLHGTSYRCFYMESWGYSFLTPIKNLVYRRWKLSFYYFYDSCCKAKMQSFHRKGFVKNRSK